MQKTLHSACTDRLRLKNSIFSLPWLHLFYTYSEVLEYGADKKYLLRLTQNRKALTDTAFIRVAVHELKCLHEHVDLEAYIITYQRGVSEHMSTMRYETLKRNN